MDYEQMYIAEVRKADEWKRKSDAQAVALREAEAKEAQAEMQYESRAHTLRSGAKHFIEKLEEEAWACPRYCDDGWIENRCGEGTCEILDSCDFCNRFGWRIPVSEFYDRMSDETAV